MLNCLDRFCLKSIKIISVTAILILTVMLFSVIILRWSGVGISGYEEIIELVFVWMMFIGLVPHFRKESLFRVTEIIQLLPGGEKLSRFIANISALAFALLFTYVSGKYAFETTQMTGYLQTSKVYWFASMPVAGVLMIGYSAYGLIATLLGKPRLEGDELGEEG